MVLRITTPGQLKLAGNQNKVETGVHIARANPKEGHQNFQYTNHMTWSMMSEGSGCACCGVVERLE